MVEATQSRTEWLKARAKGIGGSEITAVMGLDPYATPYALWERKTGRVGDFGENKFTRAGNYLEDAVGQMFADASGLEIYTKADMHHAHPDYPHLLGTPDRFVSRKNGDGVLEIKTTQKRITREDVTEGHMLRWYFQVLWYMGITGKKKGYIAWLCNGVDFDYIEVDFQPDIFADMVEAGDRFWREHVLADVPPPPITREDILKSIGKVMPDAIEGPEDALQYHKQIKENSVKIKELEEANAELKTAVQLMMGDKSILTYQGAALFTWKEAETVRLDTKKLKEDEPDIWKRFAKAYVVRTFLTK